MFTSSIKTVRGGQSSITVSATSKNVQYILINNVTVMQAMAILLLEMAYDSKDMASDDPSMKTSIKKLIRWLRAMQGNDPVAAQALGVIKKILRACAPKLQDQVSDLLAMDDDATPPQQDNHAESQHPRDQSTQNQFAQEPPAPWPQADPYGNTAGDNMNFDPSAYQQQTYDPFIVQGAYPYTLPSQVQFPLAFSNPFFTSFDQGAPVVNMQDLWLHPSAVNAGAGLSNLSNMSLDGQEEALDPVIGYSTQFPQPEIPEARQYD
jgi:hypothetical protein